MSIEFDQLLNLRNTAKALRELRDLQRSNGISYYVPHAKQHSFHKAAHATGRHCRTGNRGGKTKCGCAEDIAFCLGYRPWYLKRLEIKNGRNEVVEIHEGGEGHPLVTHGIPQRPIKLLLIVNDWDKANELFTQHSPNNWDAQGQLIKLIPSRYLHNVHKSKGGHVDRIDIARPEAYGGGISSIYIDTVEAFKHSKMSAESSDWDVIHGDEPFPREMFIGHKRGLVDRGGKFWINCTPIQEMWINDEFVPPGKQSQITLDEGVEFKSKLKDETISRFVITWSIRDNPHNSAASIAEFESSLTREEKLCRLEGLPMSYTGLVFPQFKYDEHVMSELPAGWTSFDKPPKDYTIRWWWDYHVRLPQAILYFATGPDGRIYVFDEMFDTNRIDETAEAICRRMADYEVVQTEMDPLAFVPNPVDDTTIADQLSPYGIFVEKATKDRRLATLNVQKMLAMRGPDGKPVVMFSPHLAQTLFEFARYVYDGTKQKPVDKDDHMMENLGRGLLNGLQYIEPDNSSSKSWRSLEEGRFDREVETAVLPASKLFSL